MGSGKERVLVTGGAGLIGSHLVDLLVTKGYEVNVLDSLDSQTHPRGKPSWLHPEARFIQGDIRNESHLCKALEGVRSIFHQAAFGGFSDQDAAYVDVNVNGTARIFDVIRVQKLSIEKIVVASSQAVYGEGAYECETDGLQFIPNRAYDQFERKEWDPLCLRCKKKLKPALTSEEKIRQGESPYALSKEFEERLALFYGKRLGIPVVGLRYGVTYGPRQSLFNPYTGVVSIFSTLLLNGLRPLVYEDGRQSRDFVYVEDVAQANLFVMENKLANGQVFNVGTGRATTISDLAKILASLYGKSIEPEISGRSRWGDVRHILLDPSKLKELGFSSSIDLKRGLGRFVEWIKTQGRIEEYFTSSYENLRKKGLVCG